MRRWDGGRRLQLDRDAGHQPEPGLGTVEPGRCVLPDRDGDLHGGALTPGRVSQETYANARDFRPYIVKGLQRLSAPLFGTRIGRRALRLALLPALAAWVLLQITDLVWGLFTPAGGHPVLTNSTAILLLGGTLSAAANTHSGRRAVRLR